MADGDTDPALQSSIDDLAPNAPLPAVSNDVRTAPARGSGRRAAKPEAKVGRGEVGQAEPTQPRAVDTASGLQLDEHGLPISGPARRRWLEDAGIEIDPALKAADEAENADG